MKQVRTFQKVVTDEIVTIKCDFCDALIAPNTREGNRTCAVCQADICPIHRHDVACDVFGLGWAGDCDYICPDCQPILEKHRPHAEKLEEEFELKIATLKSQFERECQATRKRKLES